MYDDDINKFKHAKHYIPLTYKNTKNTIRHNARRAIKQRTLKIIFSVSGCI